MIVHIITNLDQAKGLHSDYVLLRKELEKLGHKVRGVSFQSGVFTLRADLNIFCETFMADALHTAPVNWYIPNPEWHMPQYDLHRDKIDLVLCKTPHALKAFSDYGDRAVFTGFLSRDRQDASVPRKRQFLHLAGTSKVKNTEAVLRCWNDHKPKAKLVCVAYYYDLRHEIPNVEFHTRVDDATLRRLQNESQFHLIPSEYEGWGHAIHEGMSCGATMLLTDAEPMRSFLTFNPNLITSISNHSRCRALMHEVHADYIHEAVQKAWNTSDEDLLAMAVCARKRYESDCALFRSRLAELTAA